MERECFAYYPTEMEESLYFDPRKIFNEADPTERMKTLVDFDQVSLLAIQAKDLYLYF